MNELVSRRQWLHTTAQTVGTLALLPGCSSQREAWCSVAAFSTDVTPPLGHALLAGMIEPARTIIDPLFAKGLVLSPQGQEPIVIVGVDWCEIRNDAYQRWRTVLAEAAGTTPQRVVVSSLHQHDAPVFDLEAQRLLDTVGLPGVNCDPAFHEQAL